MTEEAADTKRDIDRKSAYSTSLEYISDELRRLDLIIYLQFLKQQTQQQAGSMEQFKGLVISEQEIVGMLANVANPLADESLLSSDNLENRKVIDALSQLESQIKERRATSLKEGIYLSLPHLSQIFHLSPSEEECLLICLAPELDRKYERLYAYLQDDVTRKKPSVDLVFNLLCHTSYEKLAARLMFDVQAPLLKYRLLHMIDSSQEGLMPLLSRLLKLDDRIVNFLLGFEQIDSRLEKIAQLIPPQNRFNQVATDEGIQTRVRNIVHTNFTKAETARQNVVFYLHGTYGSGRHSLVKSICQDLKLNLLTADLEKMLANQVAFEEILWSLGRELLLQPEVLCLENFDRLLDDDRHQCQLRSTVEMIRTFSRLTFLLSSRPWKPQGLLNKEIFIALEFPIIDDKTRKRFWKYHLNGKDRPFCDADIDKLASRFRLTSGQIQDALVMARNLALWRSPDDGQITLEELYAACRAQSNLKLNALARKIDPKYTWEDIVLPYDQLTQLGEICNQAKYRHIVYGDWGFDRKLSLGKGLNVLFSGPPGTGKTMAAEIIANELKLELYKIDLSQVVSKYIGETEKNLDKIFTEAQTSNTILFFDEADALFGKRSEVKDAHDRYANIEIGYLLQKMEEYNGITILATNLRQNMDEAFLRRIHFAVEFPFPDEKQRELIWRTIFPIEAPIAKDIDYEFLSERLKIAGGNIKNIALTSAFYSAKGDMEIGMGQIMLAAKREFQKIGRPFLKTDLDPYYELTEGK